MPDAPPVIIPLKPAPSPETLLSAARRVVRFFNIDMSHGGLVSVETQQAIEVLDIQVSQEAERKRRVESEVVAPR